MQKICVLLAVLIISTVSFAQKANPQKPEDKKAIQGLVMQLRTAPGNTYLFDIMQGPVCLNLQMTNNPATMLPKGFETKDDAFKVGEWMIKQYKKDGHLPAMVPPHVLHQLKIDINKLYHN